MPGVSSGSKWFYTWFIIVPKHRKVGSSKSDIFKIWPKLLKWPSIERFNYDNIQYLMEKATINKESASISFGSVLRQMFYVEIDGQMF